MLHNPNSSKLHFQPKKSFVKTTLKRKVIDPSDSESDHSTSESSSHSSKTKVIYVPKISNFEDPSLPSNSNWKKGKITKSDSSTPFKTVVIATESMQVLKATAHLKSYVDSLLSHKDVAAYFSEPDSISKIRGTENYEAFVSDENTFEDVDELARKNIICSFRKINYFHKSAPVFGVLIHYELDENRNRIPVVLSEIVAYDSLPELLKNDIDHFEMENVVSFQKKDTELYYHYWLPLYVNDEHFDYVKAKVKNVLVRLSGLNKTDNLPEFEPSMIEETLIPIFGRLLAKIYRSTVPSAKDVQVLAYLYQLISKLLDVYPKLKELITGKVEAFFNGNSEDKVTKAAIDNFLVLTLFCSFDIFDHNFASLLFKKVYSVSIDLCLKAKKKTDVESTLFALNSVSKLLARYRETAFFLLNEQTSDDLENRYGLLCKKRVDVYLKEIVAINDVKSWCFSKLFNYFGDAANVKDAAADLKSSIHGIEVNKIKNMTA